MPVKKPSPADLEPIERASRAELQALQLERLRWSLAHAYDNVVHYRKKFRLRRSKAFGLEDPGGPLEVSVHDQERLAR